MQHKDLDLEVKASTGGWAPESRQGKKMKQDDDENDDE